MKNARSVRPTSSWDTTRGARTAFDFRPPASIPLYRGDPWFMPAIIWGYRMQDRFALWRASR
jgi:hypothetical protein